MITLISFSLSLYLIHISPWFLLPLVWIFSGTAMTGFFVIGHDAGHLSFSRSKVVNDSVGIFCLSILLYPFESWRIKHNWHHTHTNKLHVDNACNLFIFFLETEKFSLSSSSSFLYM